MPGPIRFIHKNGKIIPIRDAANAVAAARTVNSVGQAIARPKKSPAVKVNRGLDLAGLGLSVASGALAAATFSTPKGFVGGHAAAHAIDIAGVTANAASVAGRGHLKDRAKQAAKQEGRNFAVGNAVYIGGVIGFKKNREAAVKYTAKAANYAKDILIFAKKGLKGAL